MIRKAIILLGVIGGASLAYYIWKKSTEPILNTTGGAGRLDLTNSAVVTTNTQPAIPPATTASNTVPVSTTIVVPTNLMGAAGRKS